MLREDKIDPDNPRSNRTYNRQDHRNRGMSHPSQRSRDQIHNAAEEIWYCCYGKDLKSALDHLRVSRIDLQDLGTKHIGSHAEHHRYSY